MGNDLRKRKTAASEETTVSHSMVGMTGFEPAASASRTQRSTKLSHIPKCCLRQQTIYYHNGFAWQPLFFKRRGTCRRRHFRRSHENADGGTRAGRHLLFIFASRSPISLSARHESPTAAKPCTCGWRPYRKMFGELSRCGLSMAACRGTIMHMTTPSEMTSPASSLAHTFQNSLR